MQILEFKSIEEFQNLKNFFLYKNLNLDYFQCFDFIKRYLIFNTNNFSIYIIKDKYKFIILPLNTIKFKFVKLKGFIGSPHISEENNVIHNVSKYDEFEAMLNIFFKKKKIKFFFNNIPDGFLKSYLDKKFNQLNFYSANIINLKHTGENYNKIYIKEKKYFDYIFRKFKKDHNFNLNNLIKEDLESSSIDENFIKEFIKKNKIENENYHKTVINLWIYLVKFNLAKVNVLKIDDHILSLIIYTIYNKKIFYLIPCYNKIYKKYSFGRMHLNELLNDFKKNDYEFFCLGAGNEKYKKILTNYNKNLFCYSNSIIIKTYFKLKNAIYK